MKFLDYSGLQRFLNKLKAIIPTKTSDIQNDSGYLTQHNPVDSALSTTSENAVQNKVVKDALDGKSDTGHTHTASEVSGLSTVATSGSYNDLSNTPTIPTVNNKTLTIQKNGTTVNTFTANSASDVTANITVPTAVSELTNDSGYLTSASSLDSSKLTGTIDIARLPKGALERLVTVANQTARFALTSSDVQLGDTVKQLDTGVMYIVTDESKLNSADGYTEYTAGSATSVPWSGVTGKPSDFTPSSHTHGNVTNDGKLPTASRALISDSSKNITTSSVTDTELGYLSGVTSSVQTQLNAKADDSGVVHKSGDETIAGTKTFSGQNVYTSVSYGNRIALKNTGLDLSNGNSGLTDTYLHFMQWVDNSDTIYALLQGWTKSANSTVSISNRYKTDANTTVTAELRLENTGTAKSFYSNSNGDTDLGTSSKRWKSVYGDSYYLGTTAFGDIATHNASEFSASNHVHGNITNDGKVGTTANKPLITGTGGVIQAGSFGNAANTFCEGNDSRLSDARTPVAHTHTKADVTDLLNSNFIPSANNSYNLGSSSYQWNNLYAKNYYYNGTEFQNKFVTLDSNQTITGVKTLIDYWHLQAKNLKAGEGEIYGRTGYSLVYTDKNDVTMGDVTLFKNANAARTFIRIRGGDYYTNGAPAADGTLVQSVLVVGTNVSGKKIIECDSDIVYPTTGNATDLGTSGKKWKTLNGINPGALSLPDTLGVRGTENVNYFNVIGYLNNTGTLATIPSTATYDGWLYINAKDGADSYIIIDDYSSSFGTSVYGNNGLGSSSVGLLCLICPIRAGHSYNVRIKSDGIVSARIYPAQGNV